MDQYATWYTEVGLDPGHIMFDEDPTTGKMGAAVPLSEDCGTAASTFRPMFIIAKRSPISATVELLLHISSQYPYTLQWAAPSLEITPSHGGSRPHLIYGFSFPHECSTQLKRHLDRLSRFCRAHHCNRQTDKPRYSVGNKRPRLGMQYCYAA